jgi:hypothetical protein
MNLIDQRIAKNTVVCIRTTNGGTTVVKLAEEYRPSYSVRVQNEMYAAGAAWLLEASRIRSIEPVNNYWTAPMTAAEEENIRELLSFRRRR